MKFEKCFENVICPVLMLPSEEEWESKEIKVGIEKFQELLKSSQVVVIPGGSHAYVAFQYPLEFSKVIQAFHKEIEQ
jgi:2-succinyl-6-hydroxy-2,4-cyclohexadiene-1-carboxylate synthase